MPLSLSHRFALASAAVSAIFFSLRVQAQIVPDGTLGTQAIGACGGTGGACGIINGTTRGSNLFHSFQQFSLPNGDAANFITNATIQNVIVRVTGVGQPFISNINGTIQTSNPANFFLLNPNGIIFGPGADLNIGGSFLATTAERMQFQDGTVFDIRDKTVNPLLTVSVPTGLQMGNQVADIQVDSAFLFSPSGTTLALVGGNVTFSSAFLNAPEGRIEVGSVAETGLIKLTQIPQGWALDYSNIQRFGDIQLSDTFIRGSGDPSSDIQIQSQNLTLSNNSRIFTQSFGQDGGQIVIRARGTLEAGKDSFISTTNLVDGKAGNITLKVGTLNLRDQAEIIAQSDSGAGGNLTIQATNSVNLLRGSTISTASLFGNAGGDLLIETGDLQIIGDAVVDTGSFGGRSGNITIRAKNSVALREAASLTSFSFVGRGGDIDIETKNFALLGGSQLFTATFGEQPAGSVNVRALDTIEIAGITNGLVPQSSGIFTRASGQGNAGNITLKTNQLSMRDRGQVSASSLLGSSGRGGNIDIQANSVEVIGTADIFNRTAIDTRADGTGAAGKLSISSNILSIQNGAQISASTLGYAPGGTISITSDLIEIIGQPANSGASEITAQTAGFGNQPAGNIQLSTSILAVRNGGQVNANTLGRGDAGNIVISAQDLVLLSGTDGSSVTGVFSNVAKEAQGNGGNIQISTDSLEVLNGAQLFATTLGSGDAGNVLIQAQDAVLITRTDAVGRSSGLFTSTISDGQGGNITVNTRTFQLSDGAVVDARTALSGNSGNVAINAATVDVLNGGQLLAITEGRGRAGSITVNASDRLTIAGTDSIYATRLAQFDTQVSPISASSGIFVRSQGTGGAGDVTVNAPQIRMDRGIISAESAAVDGGNINLNVGQLLLLRNGSLISATAGTAEAAKATL